MFGGFQGQPNFGGIPNFGGGGGAMAMSASTPEESMFYSSIAAAIQPVVHLEKEWDSEKFQKKMIEYMNKAAKGVSYGSHPFEQVVKNFCNKFYESYWRALGDRYAYVEQIDFSAAFVAAVKYLFPKQLLATVASEEDLVQKVFAANSETFDTCRWFSWGYQVVKTVVPGKTSQKKVSEAVDKARECLVQSMAIGQGPLDNDSFMQSWIQSTVDKLGQSASDLLHKPIAVKLFNELVQNGGGMPHSLAQVEGKPPPNWPVIDQAVGQAYASAGQATHTATMASAAAYGMGGGGASFNQAMASPGFVGASMGMPPMGFNPWAHAMQGNRASPY